MPIIHHSFTGQPRITALGGQVLAASAGVSQGSPEFDQ
jgi:hypothetical protein